MQRHVGALLNFYLSTRTSCAPRFRAQAQRNRAGVRAILMKIVYARAAANECTNKLLSFPPTRLGYLCARFSAEKPLHYSPIAAPDQRDGDPLFLHAFWYQIVHFLRSLLTALASSAMAPAIAGAVASRRHVRCSASSRADNRDGVYVFLGRVPFFRRLSLASRLP